MRISPEPFKLYNWFYQIWKLELILKRWSTIWAPYGHFWRRYGRLSLYIFFFLEKTFKFLQPCRVERVNGETKTLFLPKNDIKYANMYVLMEKTSQVRGKYFCDPAFKGLRRDLLIPLVLKCKIGKISPCKSI